MKLLLCLAPLWLTLLGGQLPAAVTFLSDGDFLNPNWSEVDFGSPLVAGSNAQAASGGNPGPFRQITVSFPDFAGGTTLTKNLASFGALLVFDPSVIGAITQIEFSYQLATQSSVFGNGFGGAYRPMLRQNGRIYFLNNVNDVTSSSAWTTFTSISTNPSDWGEVNAGVTLPDFSATGSPIEFGYRTALTAVCPSTVTTCSSGSVLSGIDNYQVTVTSADRPSNDVPEPSTMGLFALGGTLLVIRRNWRW
ncbi:MAG: PEP-CTERM sorting domain-containing protein [Bryobacterales bacterium]|nr:PEP-CTERM sorting domain-containing protein [Bryobacterales bacterium]